MPDDMGRRGRPRKGERARGPYFDRRLRKPWVIRIVRLDGEQSNHGFATEAAALAFKRQVEAQLVTEALTVHRAIEAFLEFKRTEGRKPTTIDTYRCALLAFCQTDAPLWAIDEGWCQAQYDRLTTRVEVDSHRSYLAQAKTFFRWCAKKKWLAHNPAENVEGVGRRRKGKPQLTVSELRIWDGKAHELAAAGDVRAVGALFALWLGERASEIVRARVRDVFDRERSGDSIQVPDSKTDAGVRILEVAEPLCDYIAELCRGKKGEDFLFPSKRSSTGHRDRGWPRKQVRRICQLVGVRLVSAHSMRGAHTTVGGLMGASSHLLAEALGHRNPLVTERHYAKPGVFEAQKRRRTLKVLTGGKR